MRFLPVATILTLTACGSSALEGTLKDDAGNAVSEVTITIDATEEVGLTCQKFGATTDENGTFSLDGVCSSQTAYTVKLSDEGLWLADGNTIEKGATGPVNLVVTRHGGGPGVYHQNAEGLSSVRTSGDVRTLPKGDAKVSFLQNPKNVLVLPAGEKLVINGVTNIDGYKWHKLTPAMHPLELGTADEPAPIPEGEVIWITDGQLTADGYTPGAAVNPDPGKVTMKSGGEVKVVWITGDALPAGRYALYKDDGRRAIVIDMGEAQKAPEAPATPE